MEQNKTWMSYLLIGISLMIIGALASCSKDIDYNAKADFIFINDTDYDIKFDGDGSIFNVNARDTTIYFVSTEGPESVNENSFESPLHTYCYPCILKYNDVKCDTIQDNGPASIDNFVSRRIGERHIEYTYKFTKEHFDDANQCE